MAYDGEEVSPLEGELSYSSSLEIERGKGFQRGATEEAFFMGLTGQ